MGIIEKLGIIDIDRSNVMYGDYIGVPEKDLDKLEQQNREMLEALIKAQLKIDAVGVSDLIFSTAERFMVEINKTFIPIIEKVDPQHRSWQEIKELIL